MSEINVNGSTLGSSLQDILMAEEIRPGDDPSYQLCKTLLAYHPLGQKMAESPISLAQSQARKITVPAGPEDVLAEAFTAEWTKLGANDTIHNLAKLARTYGVASLALLSEGTPPDRAVNFAELWDKKIAFNVLDPLNTAGSLVLNQDPNDLDFQKVLGISVAGQRYHRSRSVTLLNERPLYIEYTNSAFGYVGRSVFQRALYPLKSFVQTMVTDDMVSLKAGVLIAKMKPAGSIANQRMAGIMGLKRAVVQEAVTDNVISITTDEDIESLNLQNLDGAFGNSRKNIIDNIATAGDMPAIFLNQETFAEGFGEGTEDAKRVVQYVNRMREWMKPAYDFMDVVCMFRAWNPEFYKTIQKRFPEEYGSVGYTQAFYSWRNSFTATWPSLIEEPESELIKVDDVKLKATVAMLEVLMPSMATGENRAALIQWAAENFNGLKRLFTSPLVLDYEAISEYEPPVLGEGEGEGEEGAGAPVKPAPPFSARDSAGMRGLSASVAKLPDLNEVRRRRMDRGR